MANDKFMYNFTKRAGKKLKKIATGPPVLSVLGESYDHDKGIMSDLKLKIIPFSKEKYQASEWVSGHIPMNNPMIPKLYFQFSVLNIKRDSVPGIGFIGAVCPYPIKETYVSTWSKGLTNYLLPLSVIADETVERKKAYLEKIKWPPLLENVNTDKKAVKAIQGFSGTHSMGKYKVSYDHTGLTGVVHIMPYKGKTLIVIPDSGLGDVNKPWYHFEKAYNDMLLISDKIRQFPETDEEVGSLLVNYSNSALYNNLIRDIEGQ